MSYAEKYQLQYTDLDGNVIKIVISQKDYVGAVSNLIGSENPSESGLDKQNDDRFETLKPTYLKLNFFVDTAGDFDEFYDIDNFEYLVTKYINTVPEWSGFISDEVFQEPYSSGKYIINLTAIDGLSILKGRYTVLTGRKSHMEMIRECLDAIGLGLNIVDGIEAVELGHSASGGPLSQTYFDANLFADKDGKRWTLDKILKDILTTYGANIVQVHNKWVISSIESYFDGVSGWEYTSAGEYVGEYQNIEEKAITAQLGDDQVTLLTGGTIQKRKGWKELSVKTTFGKIEQEGIILNGSFSIHPGYSAGDDYSANSSHELLLTGWDHSDSLAPFPHMGVKIRTNQATGDYVYIKEPGITESAYYIQTFLNDAKPLLASSSKLYVFSFMYAMLADAMLFSGKQKGKLKVEVVNDEGVTTHWLAKDPTWWATSETFIETPEVTLYTKDAFDWTQGVLNIIGFPGGRIRVTLYSENKLASFQYSGIAWDEILFYSKEVSQAPDRGVLTGYPTDNPNLVTIPSELEFMQTDAPVENPEDAVLFFKNYLSLSDGTPTSSWSTTHHSGTLAQIYLYACLEAHGKAIQVKNTPGRGLISPLTRLQAGVNDHGGKKFQIVSYSHRDKINQFTAEIIEIIEPGTIPITTNFTGDESSSGGSGGNGETTATTEPTTDDRLVAMLEEDGLESGAPGKLYGKYHDFEGVGSTLAYYPMGMGIGNYDAFHDYKETIAGMYALIGTGQTDYWCATCRLFSIGDGVDADHRSNAFTMYKSGYAEFTNAIVLGAYLWRDPLVGPPWDGSMQYITDGNYWSFQGYYNGAWHDFIMDDSFYYINLMDTPSSYGAVGTFPFMDTADTLGWSAYTMPIGLPDVDSVAVITSAGTSSWMDTSLFKDAWLKGGQNIGAKKTLGSTDNYDIGFITNNTERMSIGTDGLVNPLFNVRLENTTYANQVGIIYKGTVPWIHNFNYGNNGTVTTIGGNFFAGGAGNLTMGATATATHHSSYNTFSGFGAGYSNTTGFQNTFSGLQAGYSNTTGFQNTFSGYQSGYSNTTGYNNTFSGASAGYHNTTGYYNTFSGLQAGYSNTTGYDNTFSGYQSGYSNTTGSSNTFSGFQAARYIANGTTRLTVVNQSIFIGADTKAKINNSTNEIAIGYNVTGNGSNTATIGNTSITDNYLNGNLQIGNKFKILEGGATPTKFTTFQGGDQTDDIIYTLPTAYPGASGYVLSSTDAGVLSWVEVSAGWELGGNTLGKKDYLGSIDNYDIAFKTNDIERMSIGTDGLVNPLFNVRLENTTHTAEIGIIYKGTVPFLHNFNYGNNGVITTAGGNTFVGENAGNLTMGATASSATEASYNTFVGTQVGITNTTGYANVFVGYQAGYTNDTGSGNVFIGYQSGYYNESSGWANTFNGYQAGYTNYSGGSNTFNGYQAGYANSTGGFNTAVGMQAGKNNITGEENVFIGYQAGSHLADDITSLTIVNRSVYIGYDAKSKQNACDNEIVIGYNAIGNGSNTVTIGNTSITDNFLSGNLQIGNKLKILEGGLTPSYYTIFQGGDQSADLTYTLPTAYPVASGYVLSSTDAGVMSWIEMSAGSEIWYLNGGAACYDSSVYIGETVNRNGLLTVYGDVGTFAVGADGISYVRTGSSSDTIFILNSTSGGTNPGYMASWVAYNDTKYLKCVNGTSGTTLFEIGASGQITSAGNAYPTTTGTAGQVLTTDGAGVLSWQNAGAGSCYWSSVAGGITYNNNAYVYSDGYLALDNAILISPCTHTGFGNGTLQYTTSGRFAGRWGLFLFHDSNWHDLVEWNDNYLVNLIDVMTLGAPASDALLLVHSDRTVDWKLLSSFAWVADTYGINYTGGSIGIGTNSQSSYFMYVAGSGKTSIIQAYASDSSTAVDGLSQSGYGVKGQSNGGYAGVWGHSNSGAGVYGESHSGYGGVFAGTGVNISAGGLSIGGNTVINSSRIADFASLKIGGTERIDSSGNVKSSNGYTGTYTDVNNNTLTFVGGICTGNSQ